MLQQMPLNAYAWHAWFQVGLRLKRQRQITVVKVSLFYNEIISVNVSKTNFEVFSLEFINIYRAIYILLTFLKMLGKFKTLKRDKNKKRNRFYIYAFDGVPLGRLRD